MKNRLFFSISVLYASILASGCSKPNATPEALIVPQVIDQVLVSQLFDEIKYLGLWSENEAMPSRVDQLEFHNDETFILDKQQNKIFRFSKEGKMIAFLDRKGEGPGEYIYLHRFLIDSDAQTLELYDKGKQEILVFDLNFNFLESFKINLFLENFVKLSNRKYLCYLAQENFFMDESVLNNLVVWDKGKLTFSDIPQLGTDSRFQFKGLAKDPSDGMVHVTQSFNDTIYKYSPKSNSIVGKQKVVFPDPIEGIYSSIDEVNQAYMDIPYSSNIDYLHVSPDLVSFNYYHRDKGRLKLHSFYHFTNTNTIINSKKLINDNDDFNLFEHMGFENGYLVNVILPDYLAVIDIKNTSKDFQNTVNGKSLEDQIIILFLKPKKSPVF